MFCTTYVSDKPSISLFHVCGELWNTCQCVPSTLHNQQRCCQVLSAVLYGRCIPNYVIDTTEITGCRSYLPEEHTSLTLLKTAPEKITATEQNVRNVWLHPSFITPPEPGTYSGPRRNYFCSRKVSARADNLKSGLRKHQRLSS